MGFCLELDVGASFLGLGRVEEMERGGMSHLFAHDTLIFCEA